MKLATIRTADGTRAVRIDADLAVELGHPDLGALLRRPGWRAEAAAATGETHPLDGLDYAPVAGSTQVDWEAELGVVIGAPVRHASAAQARAAIAGYTVVNDITARDFQYRSVQWLQGKTFEASTPVGRWLVTDADPGEITCLVDGDVVQKADTGDLVHDAVTLIQYISSIITLVPGDLIATGTPGGVGHARKPPRYLAAGSEVVTRIEGVSECRNTCAP